MHKRGSILPQGLFRVGARCEIFVERDRQALSSCRLKVIDLEDRKLLPLLLLLITHRAMVMLLLDNVDAHRQE